MTVAEPFASRWKRRARTIPMMLASTVVGVLASPIILTAAAVGDIAKRRFRMPTARVALFLLQYAINDSIEIVLAFVYWLRAGFGTRLDQPMSVERHERLQRWSVDILVRRADRLLGLRPDIDPESAAVLGPGPVIVLCRHVNLFDAAVPILLYRRLDYRTRYVMMAELLADPWFDIVFSRTGSIFIPRDNGPEARAMLRDFGRGADSTTAIAIFPEGRLFRPERLHRTMAELTDENPDRARRLASLSHVLPPRSSGVLALLRTIPEADVVVIAHAGFERFASVRDLAKVVPLHDPIRVVAWRTPSADIPTDDPSRIEWLDQQWRRVDDWVSRNVVGDTCER